MQFGPHDKVSDAIESKKVLVANRYPAEIAKLRSVLEETFRVFAITSPTDYKPGEHGADAILLDTNFTESQGFDFLKEIDAHCYAPVIVLTPENDPKCAVEAMRRGAFNFLVKTASFRDLLAYAITDSIRKFSEQDALVQTLAALKQRVNDLETQIEAAMERNSGESAQISGGERRRAILEEIVHQLRQGDISLPSYPEINIKLKRLIDSHGSSDQIKNLLEKDVAISSKLISLSNSPFYRTAQENKTLEQAISRLGLSTTRHYVEIISNRALHINNNKKYQSILQTIWTYSISCAHASYLVAGFVRSCDPDEAFTMGLLHNIGGLFLVQIISEMEAKGLLHDEMFSGDALKDFLYKHQGIFGKALLQRWKLPEIFGQVALYHNNLDAVGKPFRELLVVNFASMFINTIGYRPGHINEQALSTTRSAKLLHLSSESIQQLRKQFNERNWALSRE